MGAARKIIPMPKSKAKRKPVRKKKVVKQTGTSNVVRDRQRQAKKPGKRVTSHGTSYTETRANRSDKGVLLGIGAINRAGIQHYETRLGKLHVQKLAAKTIRDTKKISKQITEVNKQLRKFL